MQRRHILLIGLFMISTLVSAQEVDTLPIKDIKEPKLILDIMFADAPYLKYSGQARANYKASVPLSQSVDAKFGDYIISAFSAPSMSQVISYTSSFYNTLNYGVAKGWNKILNPEKSKSARIFNTIGSEFTAAAAFVFTTKVPFAGGWAHEEFHRNTWTPMGIGSYNLIWELNLAPDALTNVGGIYDEDLAALKKNDPSGFVRMGSAGIEAHYLLSERIQTQDFLYNTNIPNLALYWADFAAAADYVNRSYTKKTIDEHTEEYNDEPDQLKRDFTGNDFTAWVYDLYNSTAEYTERGVHPTGIGIDRYRDYNDLSTEMLSYVEKIGNRQWLNLINPFMFRFREITLNESLGFNFAVRHYLTSFGDDLQLDVFLNQKNSKCVITLHKYSNHDQEWYPGIEMNKHLSFLSFNKSCTLNSQIRIMGWVQPKNQSFFTKDGQVGGLVSLNTTYKNKSPFQPYIEFEAKTKGWVAGVPYLKEKVSLRFGVHATF